MQDVPSFTAAHEAPDDSDLALASPTADWLTLVRIEAPASVSYRFARRCVLLQIKIRDGAHIYSLVLTNALVTTNVMP